ncbi:MAG: 16S rRNA (cytidine(1402)-2'-O)-methyltransferase [Clostridiales bacterium]|nr:16S rRNA (cytidine(1402)-2'-O)-methyltransferase [Clostridiales bacterium]
MLYLVCTPIGNMKDMTYRAVEVLKEVSLILAEDTRHTLPLLTAYGISKPMLSYQKFNERARCDEVIARLQSGEDIALVTDAGTPLISDPGAVLLERVIEENLPYTLVGSSCAFVSAAVLSGFSLRTFAFGGFLPEKAGAREKYLKGFSSYAGAVAFYLSPHSFAGELESLYAAFGARRAVLVREISKKFEECVRFTLGEKPDFTEKGEYVLVIEGKEEENEKNALSVEEHIKAYMAEGMQKKDAVKRVAADRGIAKSEIYRIALTIEEE